MVKRTLYLNLWRELARDKAMIFLSGPRQAGKTTLARIIAEDFTNSLYFNWDIDDHRERLLQDPRFFTSVLRKDSSPPLIILDEIHKYNNWKNYLKGVHDEFNGEYRFLVSGSGRLDLYQQGGDSLAGRYFLFHLFPFTVAELGEKNRTWAEFARDPLEIDWAEPERTNAIWDRLSRLSGFPEPYLSGRETTYRRWSGTYAKQLVREDIRDLTDVRSVRNMDVLHSLLPSRVGSPLSLPSLAETLRTSYNTIHSWLDILERFYLTFSIPTWTARIARAIQKERKYYLFDYPRIKDPAARFENMVAAELWRAVANWNDAGLGSFSLHFIRDREKREVDFLIAQDNDPLLLIEAKRSDPQPARHLIGFQNTLRIPAVQLVETAAGYRLIANGHQRILVAPAGQWLSRLP